MRGDEITLDYFERHGFNFPIVVNDKRGLDVVLPPSNFTVQDVERLVGESELSINKCQWLVSHAVCLFSHEEGVGEVQAYSLVCVCVCVCVKEKRKIELTV